MIPIHQTGHESDNPFPIRGMARKKINKSLRPFHIKGRTVSPYPVFLHTGPKRIVKYLSGSRLDWSFLGHKTTQLQIVTVIFTV